MTSYIADSVDFASVAEAIRTKGGTTASLSWPAGYISAISAIETGGGGGGGYTIDDIAMRTTIISGSISGNASFIDMYAFYSCTNLTTASFPSCKTIGSSAFYSCKSLTTASFPSCTSVGYYAFGGCTSLSTVSFPLCKSIGSGAFSICTKLTAVNFPSCSTIGSNAFNSCTNLTTASFPMCKSIGIYAFQKCYNLVELNLTGVSSVPYLGLNVFSSTPIGGYSASAGRYGSVFVPSSLYNSFKTSANWSSISSRIVSV